jgi:(p)ppGpp synthase/HD superfamily hydrolase
MEYDVDLLIKAINFATEKHNGQFREDGKPYISHPLAVAESVTSPRARILAVLHDTFEDTNTTGRELDENFGDDMCLLVRLISKLHYESYEEYIQHIKNSSDPVIREVKIADLKHNLSTINGIKDPEKRERLKARYEQALKVLS